MKPKVGVIYSSSPRGSHESRALAYYLAGNLVGTGYAEVSLIGYRADEGFDDLQALGRSRLFYLNEKRQQILEVPSADVRYEHMTAIQDCHVLIITVSADDVDKCCAKIKEFVQLKKNIVIFSMTRGHHSSSLIKDTLASSKNITAIETVVGFCVAESTYHASSSKPLPHSAYVPTVPRPQIAMERLSKEIEGAATGPVNLIECMGIPVLYRRNLSTVYYGNLLYENIYAISVLSKLSVAQTMRTFRYRLLFAYTIREACIAMGSASRGNGWTPDMCLVSTLLTPRLLELLLCLPSPLFDVASYLLGMHFSARLMSPIVSDIQSGRTSNCMNTIKEMITMGSRYSHDMLLTKKIYEKICEIEGAGAGYKSLDCAAAVAEAEAVVYQGRAVHSSLLSLSFVALRVLAVVSAASLLYFLFMHEV